MLLKLTVNDANNAPRWRFGMRLDFGPKQWSIEDDSTKAWSNVSAFTNGSFEYRLNGVIWIFDSSQPTRDRAPVPKTAKRTPIIIWDAPKEEADTKRPPGGGLLFDPKDSGIRDAKISWSIDTITAKQPQLSAIRQKILDICRGVLPPAIGTLLTPGQGNMTRISQQTHSVHGETNCGDFPGWIAKQIPGGSGLVPERLYVPKYKLKDGTEVKPSTIALTQSMIVWEKFAINVETLRKLPKGTIWIPYDKGHPEIRPQPGDFYVLVQKPNSADFAHVGIMVDSTGDTWITADCGQGSASAQMEDDPNNKGKQRHKFDKGMSAGFQHRKFNAADGSIRGEFGSTAWLKGWVNVDELFKGWKG